MQIIPTQTPQTFNLAALDRAALQPSTREKYKRALMAFLNTGATLADGHALATYAQTLPQSGRAFLKAAIRILAEEMTTHLKGNATPENLSQTQAAIMRLESLTSGIHAPQTKGEKLHTWLSPLQIKKLMGTCHAGTLEGRRDWVVLALMVGAGLRREELAGLTFEDVQTVTTKGRERTVLQITGKGAKNRTVPVNATLAARLAEWKIETGGGKIARSLGRSQELGESLSGVGIFEIVRKAGKAIDLPTLAPHDLRRSYAQTGFEAGVSLTQISTLLGHSDVKTTQRYLNLALDLENSICDFVPL